MADQIRGVLFDKDGTLFDFQATWNSWAKVMLSDLAGGDEARAADLAELLDFDYAAGGFRPTSGVIAGTAMDIVTMLSPGVPDIAPADLLARIDSTAATAPQAEAVPLTPLLEQLKDMGLKLGVATNDSEIPARAHLASAGVEDAFDFIAGYDSGYGGKPEPGMCFGFAEAMGLAPVQCLMVGDSTHDLFAGRAAGMTCVAVLTGMAGEVDLAPHSDVVLPDVGHLPGWISNQS